MDHGQPRWRTAEEVEGIALVFSTECSRSRVIFAHSVTVAYYVLVHVLAEAVHADAAGARQLPVGPWGLLQEHHDQVHALSGRESQSEYDVPRHRQGVSRLPHGPQPDDTRGLVQARLRRRNRRRQENVTSILSSRINIPYFSLLGKEGFSPLVVVVVVIVVVVARFFSRMPGALPLANLCS